MQDSLWVEINGIGISIVSPSLYTHENISVIPEQFKDEAMLVAAEAWV